MATNDEISSTVGHEASGVLQPGRDRRVLHWSVILLLAILAGMSAWLIGESTFEYYKPSAAASENYQDSTRLNIEMPWVLARNGAITFGTLGACLGVAMGLAGAFVTRSRVGAINGVLAGLFLGALAGALPSFYLMPWQYLHRNEDPATSSLLAPLLIHLGLWSAIGIASGVAMGIGASLRPSRILEMGLAGLCGAILGTCLYEILGAFFMPLAFTALPFSTTQEARLLARVSVAFFVALALARSLPAIDKRITA